MAPAVEQVDWPHLATPDGPYINVPVKAATKVFEGALVGDDASGYARGLVALDPFLGVAWDEGDNSAGAAGDVAVRVRSQGVLEGDVAGATGPGDRDTLVYASDDNTLTTTSTGNTLIGKIIQHVSGTKCLVFYQAAALRIA